MSDFWDLWVPMGVSAKGEKNALYTRLMKYSWVIIAVGVVYWYYRKRKGVRA